MWRQWKLLVVIVLLLLAACGTDVEEESQEEPGVEFRSVAAPQYGGGYEEGLWEQVGPDHWRINDALEPALALYQEEEFSDVYMEITVTLLRGEDATIVLNYTEGSYYFAGLGAFQSRYAIGRQDRDDTAPQVLASYGLDQDLEPRVPVTLSLTLRFTDFGAHIVLEAGGEPVLEVMDHQPLDSGGLVGLRTWRTTAEFALQEGPQLPDPENPD